MAHQVNGNAGWRTGLASSSTTLESCEVRTEQQVFDELKLLCRSPGYIHAIAHVCFRDNIIRYSGEMKAEDLYRMSSMERLSRTEISTLIGLMIQAPIDDSMPAAKVLDEYVKATDGLMLELHRAMSAAAYRIGDWKKLAEQGRNPFEDAEALREAIFYSGESAYNFQYRDLAPTKYQADNAWLEANKGFGVHVAKQVVLAVERVQSRKVPERLEAMRLLSPDEWTFLPGFEFTASEIATEAGLDEALVKDVLSAFTIGEAHGNDAFAALHDFNAANAFPLIERTGESYLLLQMYGLGEALYEAPFYWMMADKAYQGTATNNRGRFAEEFSESRLVSVFGRENVFANVHVFESKGRELCEIDVLVVFADRAIVLQSKSKRLTIEARKGNDRVLKDDFKKSVQDSYDQGRLCATALTDATYTLVDTAGKELATSRSFKEIYILCVVSDNYPALSFQARQFLKHQETEAIRPPFVLDVFALDALAEMLQSPLRFLSYLNRRTGIDDSVLAAQELTILSYHLKKNLWVEGNLTMMSLDGSIASDLDIAMFARREGIPGKTTPEGILTAFDGTILWHLIEDIEEKADPGMIDLGFLLLAMSGDAIKDANRAINLAAVKARRDGATHDLTMLFGDVGFTAHVSDAAIADAMADLQRHCERRKYAHKADSWLGVCLDSATVRLRFGLSLNERWKQDASLDELTKDLPTPSSDIWDALSKGRRKVAKVRRNDPCPCGSGVKYKKCCL
ncbi:Prepilin peptidase [Rubrivivax sp. A210]|uniref:nuclease-related domain-containing protein n=1 Tax=Rubrivivax sp. A210 TaxID=2772301 RepID=UPI00191B02B6|nr:nuclease-related domain-containing protein [Rubrivivax sp. A210]CAD5373538.1 Prepilin peptidase [Rubrivivax sp. A210]